MTKEELAEKLTGREYGSEISNTESSNAKSWGLVVVFGYSDDNVELRGAISDEIGSCDGADIFVTPNGLLENKCEDEDCPYFEAEKSKAVKISAMWCAEEGYSWTYKTDIPHATFEIMENGEHYCRGIVFSLSDVPPAPKPKGD